MTALHFAVKKGYFKIVKFFIEEDFTYYNSNRKFDKQSILNSQAGNYSNTCLHFAILKNR